MFLDVFIFDSIKHEAIMAFNNVRDCLLLDEDFKILYSELSSMQYNINLLEYTEESTRIVSVILKALKSDIVQEEINLKYPEFLL